MTASMAVEIRGVVWSFGELRAVGELDPKVGRWKQTTFCRVSMWGCGSSRV